MLEAALGWLVFVCFAAVMVALAPEELRSALGSEHTIVTLECEDAP